MADTLGPESLRALGNLAISDAGIALRTLREADLHAHADVWVQERDTKGNFKALARCRAEKRELEERLAAARQSLEAAEGYRAALIHILNWAGQSQGALTSRQVADAVMTMCQDALAALKEKHDG